MTTVEQVPMWLRGVKRSDIWCVLASTKSGWHQTLCGTFTPNGSVVKGKGKGTRPKGLCAKCRKALKTANLVHQEAAANA